MVGHFFVPKCLASSCRHCRATSQQSLRFFYKPVFEHCVNTVGNTLRQHFTLPAQTYLHNSVIGVSRCAWPRIAKGSPTTNAHFQRTNHATTVSGLNALGSYWVELLELSIEKGGVVILFKFCANIWPLTWKFKVVNDRGEVQARACYEKSRGSRLPQFCQLATSLFLKLRHRKTLRWVDEVDAMVRNQLLIGCCWFCSTNIHFAIHLHGIDGNNMRALHLLCCSHGYRRFTTCGGAENYHLF